MTQINAPAILHFMNNIYLLDKNLSCDIHLVYFYESNWIVIKYNKILVIYNEYTKEIKINNLNNIQKYLKRIEPELKLEAL